MNNDVLVYSRTIVRVPAVAATVFLIALITFTVFTLLIKKKKNSNTVVEPESNTDMLMVDESSISTTDF